MLPRLLSEHLCSLNSNVDRLSVSVLWTLDTAFKLKVSSARQNQHVLPALQFRPPLCQCPVELDTAFELKASSAAQNQPQLQLDR